MTATEQHHTAGAWCSHHDSPPHRVGNPPRALTAGEVAQAMTTHALGVPVTFVGEDGALLAAGHLPPRRFLAAAWTHARRDCGLSRDDVFGDTPVAELMDEVQHLWFTAWDDPDGAWFQHATDGAAGALPFTYWSGR